MLVLKFEDVLELLNEVHHVLTKHTQLVNLSKGLEGNLQLIDMDDDLVA
jgi:uncharacterized protein YejL (UPF0352 family)